MVVKKMVGALLVVVMVLAALGCDQSPGVTPSVDQFSVSAYRQVQLTDFAALGEETYDLPDFGEADFEDLLIPELMAMVEVSEELMWIIAQSIVPSRSVSAAFYLSIRDEAFSKEFSDETLEAEIEHLDIFLGGGLNSLASLLALLGEDAEFEFPVDLLEADGTMRGSFFVSGSVVDESWGEEGDVLSYTIAESGYVELNVEVTSELEEEGELEGTVSGKLHFSVGTTIVPSIDPDDDQYFYRYPLIYVIDVEPFSVAIADIMEFIEYLNSDDFDPENLWSDIAEMLWGDPDADGIVVTRIIGAADGTQHSSESMTGADIFAILMVLLGDVE